MRNPVSRFAYTSSDLGIRRSVLDRNSRHLTTMSSGLLYPLLIDEVLPGDTYSVDMSSLLRMSTPIHPVMDNCYFDIYWFFVPNRLTWEHWKNFMGEQDPDHYKSPIEYRVPSLKLEDPEETTAGIYEYGGIQFKCALDYMGIPPHSRVGEFNALPVRGFGLIWNEWFRDQNLQDPIDVPLDDTQRTLTLDTLEDENANYTLNFQEALAYYSTGELLPPVNKYHDYFTSALLEPQKGEPVPIPLSGFAPVYANELINLDESGHTFTAIDDVSGGSGPIVSDSGSVFTTSVGDLEPSGIFSPNNLGADLSKLEGLYSTISDLRYAFQLQKFLEADARGGTRYREILKSHFNVTSPDATQQVPEFLGGKRIPINITQVLQTSATNDVSPQGNTAAYSLTSDKFSAFTKSFTEHGFLYCVGCIRTTHTYQQGLEKFWFKFNKFDYYFPEFANISEQPIRNRELYNPSVDDDWLTVRDWEDGEINRTFGYQEPWAEYRYKPSRVSGEFRSTYPQSLDIWHYADDYYSMPRLSADWIAETRANVDRTLAVDSDVSDQFICDFYFKMRTVRAMPVTSIPGLADHH